MNQPRIFTIGHSNHEIASLARRLAAHQIEVVADVRSAPYSRHVPWFNKSAVETALPAHGLRYLFMGDLLGGKPRDRSLCDHTGQPDYVAMSRTAAFQQGIERLLAGLARPFAIALMCAEEDPSHCHRHHLLARELELAHGVAVFHLRAQGPPQRALEMLAGTGRQLALFPGGR